MAAIIVEERQGQSDAPEAGTTPNKRFFTDPVRASRRAETIARLRGRHRVR